MFDITGFRKEQLRVQVSSNRVLRVSGERKISENKWRRFRKEEPLSDSHDTSGISAKFEAGMLYVKLPKVMKPPSSSPPPSSPPPPPPPSPTQQKPSKPHQPTSTITDDNHKPDATQQQHHDEKDSKEDTTEESKIEEQQPLPPPRPPQEHEDSQVMLQREMSKAETGDKSRSYEEMHETTQTTVKEQKEGDEDSEKKVAQSQIKTDDDEKDMREVIGSNKAEGTGLEGLSRIGVAKMNIRLEKISDMVLEVKKQNKVANLVVLVFLVLLIGLYVKSVVKSSFAGPRNQEL